MQKFVIGSTAALILSAGIVSAATITVDFDSGAKVGATYVESGFTFSSDTGTASTATCDGSSCLQFGNNEIITVTYAGGAFTVDSFDFNGPGNGGQIDVAGGGNSETMTEMFTGNTLSPAILTQTYMDIFSFTFQNNGSGSGRVDNIGFSIATVPVPASGLLVLTGIGALMAKRRKKKA